MADRADCPKGNGSDPEDCLEVEACLVCGWGWSLLLTGNCLLNCLNHFEFEWDSTECF